MSNRPRSAIPGKPRATPAIAGLLLYCRGPHNDGACTARSLLRVPWASLRSEQVTVAYLHGHAWRLGALPISKNGEAAGYAGIALCNHCLGILEREARERAVGA